MGKTTNAECKVDWKTVLVFVSIAFSSQCGGGFASGSTPWTYFFRNTGFYGMLPVVVQPYFCLFMPFIVAAINCFIIYFFMKFAMDFRTFDYSNFLRQYGSRFCGGIFARPMQYIYEFNFNWLLIVYGACVLHLWFSIKRTDGNSISVFYAYHWCPDVCSVYERHRPGPEERGVYECRYFHCADLSSCT